MSSIERESGYHPDDGTPNLRDVETRLSNSKYDSEPEPGRHLDDTPDLEAVKDRYIVLEEGVEVSVTEQANRTLRNRFNNTRLGKGLAAAAIGAGLFAGGERLVPDTPDQVRDGKTPQSLIDGVERQRNANELSSEALKHAESPGPHDAPDEDVERQIFPDTEQ